MDEALWKYDSELGIAYFCPRCKTFICSDTCYKCRIKVDRKTLKNIMEELNGLRELRLFIMP